MSYRYPKEKTLFLQRMWKSEGLYKGKLDALWGPVSEAAEQEFDYRFKQLRDHYGELDSRSEGNLYTLTISAQMYARVSMSEWIESEVPAKIISGARTYEEQDVIYQQGRTTPGEIVTYAEPGESNHNFCTAWDIGLFHPGRGYSDKDEDYIEAAQATTVILPNGPVIWGGNFKTKSGWKDYPHYELRLGKNMRQIRVAFESGDLFGLHARAA